MEVKTAFGTTFKVNIPEEQTSPIFTDSNPMYVASDGHILSKFFDVLGSIQLEQKSQFPDPSNFNTIQEYKSAVWDFYNQFDDIKKS